MSILDNIAKFGIVFVIIFYMMIGVHFYVTDQKMYINEKKNYDIQLNPLLNYDNDTDNDGFSDKFEKEQELLNPKQKDVIVEVDYDKSVKKHDFDSVQRRFKKAPIENSDGSNGINLHIIKDDRNLDLPDTMNDSYYKNNYQIHSDYKMKGYYHAYIVDNATVNNETVGGFTNSERYSMVVVESEFHQGVTQATFMHELGHNLGLLDSKFDGIDSGKYSEENYRSVMNYNHQTKIEYHNTKLKPILNESSLRYETELINEWDIINNNLDNRPCGHNLNQIIC